jgi:hypothetical protein
MIAQQKIIKNRFTNYDSLKHFVSQDLSTSFYKFKKEARVLIYACKIGALTIISMLLSFYIMFLT